MVFAGPARQFWFSLSQKLCGSLSRPCWTQAISKGIWIFSLCNQKDPAKGHNA